jgi:hypothetical protein
MMTPTNSDNAADEDLADAALARCYQLLRQRAREHRQNKTPMTGNLAGTTVNGVREEGQQNGPTRLQA